MPIKRFISNNGDVIAVVAAILGVGWWIQSSIANVQLEQSIRLEEQSKQYQQKFTDMIEKIGQ